MSRKSRAGGPIRQRRVVRELSRRAQEEWLAELARETFGRWAEESDAGTGPWVTIVAVDRDAGTITFG